MQRTGAIKKSRTERQYSAGGSGADNRHYLAFPGEPKRAILPCRPGYSSPLYTLLKYHSVETVRTGTIRRGGDKHPELSVDVCRDAFEEGTVPGAFAAGTVLRLPLGRSHFP